MASFDMKQWLDSHVVPLVQDKSANLYSFIWNGTPPNEILVWILVEDGWPTFAKNLIDEGFRFDYLREQQMVQIENGIVPVFGGDGAPLFSPNGMASLRLFRKEPDGISLILQIGSKHPNGLAASAVVKSFFALFEDENPLAICSKYAALFGQA